MTKPRRFINTDHSADLRRGLNQLQSETQGELDRLSRRNLSPVQTGSRYTAQYGEVVRIDPPATGMVVLLPKPLLSQAGATITLMVVGDGGALTLQVVNGLINNVAEVSFLAGFGSLVLSLDAERGWYMPSGTTVPGAAEEIADERLLGNDTGATAVPTDTSVHQVLDWIPGSSEVTWTFDGVDDEVNLGDVLDVERTDAVSFTVWAAPDTAGRAMFSKQTSGGSQGYKFALGGDSTLNFIIANASKDRVDVSGSTSLPDGQLRFMTATRDTTSTAAGVTLYVNAVAESKTVNQDDLVSGTSLNSIDLKIGRRGTSIPFDGPMSHVAIWDKELSQAEVTEAYNNGLPIDLTTTSMAANLVGWWKLDESDAVGTDGILDASTNSNNGTAQNGLAPSAATDVLGVIAFKEADGLWGLVAPGAATTVLTSNGLGAAPSYQPVDYSSVTYTADESTLTLVGLEFSVPNSGIGSAQIAAEAVLNSHVADGTFELEKLEDIGAGRLVGLRIDDPTGPPTALSPKEIGESTRWNTRQTLTVTPNGGSGSGGEYTSADISFLATTNLFVLILADATAGDIVITGMQSVNPDGQRVRIQVDDSFWDPTIHRLLLKSNDGSESTSTNRLFAPNPVRGGSEQFPDIVVTSEFGGFLVHNSDLGNSASNRWFVEGVLDLQMVNTDRLVSLNVPIHNGRFPEWRQLEPNDLDSDELWVSSESDLPAAVSGVITIPDNTVIRPSGPVTFTTGNRVVLGANCLIRGFDRNRDVWTFNTAGATAMEVTTNPGTTGIADFGMVQLSATGDLFAHQDTNADRLSIDRFVAVGNGGRGLDIAASNINMSAPNITGVSTGITFTASGSVCVIEGALVSQSVGGTSNVCLDLGSTVWTFIAFTSMLIITASGGVGFDGLTANGNLTATGTADLRFMTFAGAGTAVTNITEDDLQWIFTSCKGIANSHFSGGYSMTGNTVATATSWVSTGTFVKIAGTTAENTVHRMTMSTNNEMTITRLQESPYVITAVVAAKKTGATKHLCSFGIFADTGSGFTLVPPAMSIEVSNVLNAVSVQAIADLTTSDKIEVRVANNTYATDVTVVDLSTILRQG